LVFDGRKGNYLESDSPQPLSVYAETKLAAERIVLANPRHTVIRTSLTGGRSPTGDRGFNEGLRRLWQGGETAKLFTDEFRSPLPAVVTAQATWALLAQDARGLYHLAGAERLSRWQIGQLVAARCPELRPRMEAVSLREYRGAPRSPDTSLNCAKLQARLPFPLPGLTQWLAEHPAAPF
jgi:dTDP-4-dehydrorhamnose reductase